MSNVISIACKGRDLVDVLELETARGWLEDLAVDPMSTCYDEAVDILHMLTGNPDFREDVIKMRASIFLLQASTWSSEHKKWCLALEKEIRRMNPCD